MPQTSVGTPQGATLGFGYDDRNVMNGPADRALAAKADILWPHRERDAQVVIESVHGSVWREA